MFHTTLFADARKQATRPDIRLGLFLALLGVSLSVVIAYLATTELWPLGIVLLAALPIFVLLHRYPLAGLFVWLLLTPFLVATEGGIIRRVYWLIHRLLPLATIGIILLSSILRIHSRKLPRLRWPEVAMIGYVVVSVLSIIYLSNNVMATIYLFYDRVIVPMCLYLLIRLTNPGEKDLQRLLPVFIFILISQSIIGMLSWSAPQVLPSAWLNRVGLRTTGSLSSYSVFTSTITFCGLLILQSVLNRKPGKKVSLASISVFVLTFFMVFLSFSRGSWLAGIIVIFGLLVLYPRFMLRLGIITVPVVALLLSFGLLAEQISWANQRFYSDQSAEAALSRLPIYYASYRMFEEKPLLGWGYGNFDRFDRQFQERVAGLVSPAKDHASHNVYLTLVAEQGLVGFTLFLIPLFFWLIVTLKAWRKMPGQGYWSRKLVIIFWLVIVFHIVVNNFSNMRVVFGLGIWWITLGFIANIVQGYTLSKSPARVSEPAGQLREPRLQPVPALHEVDRMEEAL